MNGLLDFLARTGEKFEKDEIYTFIAGFTTGAAYYIFLAGQIRSLIGEISFTNPLFFLSLIFCWLFFTGLIYITENLIIIFSYMIFWVLTCGKNWENEVEIYRKKESQVRNLNEFSQFTSSMHIFGLISSAFIFLGFLNGRISSSFPISSFAIGMILWGGVLIGALLVIRIAFRWLRLERLFLLRAFVVVNDVNTFLSYYGVVQPQPIPTANPPSASTANPTTTAKPQTRMKTKLTSGKQLDPA